MPVDRPTRLHTVPLPGNRPHRGMQVLFDERAALYQLLPSTQFPPASVMESIAEHICAGYPQEVCGAWFVTAAGTWGTRPWNNQYTDPQGRCAFSVHPLDLLTILQEHDQQKLRWVGMYHSHPNSPPFLSTQDLDALTFQNMPLYPELHLLIAGISDRMELCWNLYAWAA